MVRLIARSPRTRIFEVQAGRVVVRVSAAPVDGAANLALVKLLAKALVVPAGTIRIAARARTKDKSVSVAACPRRRSRVGYRRSLNPQVRARPTSLWRPSLAADDVRGHCPRS